MATSDDHSEIHWDIDDPEIRWFASSSGTEYSERTSEKILYGNGIEDQRYRISTAEDDRLIIQCIGRISSRWAKDFHEKRSNWGTGTVFDYDRETDTCYVLTCAHNVVKRDVQAEERTMIKALSVQFYAIETLPIPEKTLNDLHSSGSSNPSPGLTPTTHSPMVVADRSPQSQSTNTISPRDRMAMVDNNIDSASINTNATTNTKNTIANASANVSSGSVGLDKTPRANSSNDANISNTNKSGSRASGNESAISMMSLQSSSGSSQYLTNLPNSRAFSPMATVAKEFFNVQGRHVVDIENIRYHPRYKLNCNGKDNCRADLAVLAFKDTHDIYKKLFNNESKKKENQSQKEKQKENEEKEKQKKQEQEIELFACEDIKSSINPKSDILCYELYGFPLLQQRRSKVVNGGLYGMKANIQKKITDVALKRKGKVKGKIKMEKIPQNDNEDNKSNDHMHNYNDSNINSNSYIPFVRLNDKNEMFFYDAIDTEAGQSGSPLFIETSNVSNTNKNDANATYTRQFKIVGVHTGGDKSEDVNWAVALNTEKIEWIRTGKVKTKENGESTNNRGYVDSMEQELELQKQTHSGICSAIKELCCCCRC